MSLLWKWKHAHEFCIVFLKLLSHCRELFLGKVPEATLRRLPIIGGHDVYTVYRGPVIEDLRLVKERLRQPKAVEGLLDKLG